MKLTNRFDKKHRIVYIDALGTIYAEDFIANQMKILDHPDFERDLNALWDLSKTQVHHSLDIEKLREISKFVDSIQGKAGNGKWAVVATDDDVFAFAIMYEMIVKELSVETKVFRDIAEARSWLGL